MRNSSTHWPAGRSSLAPLTPQVSSSRAAGGLLRHSKWDALLVALALGHGALLLLAPPFWIIALGLWWNANTVSHNFIHLPFFRSRSLNRLFSAYLSLLLGFPQSLWRERHLAHHRESGWSWSNLQGACFVEATAVLVLWSVLMKVAPGFFLHAYLPGWLLGLALCQLQGHFEHVRGTMSHYSRLYNWLFFNDGFHVEHHSAPTRHWTQLAGFQSARGRRNESRWPAVFRWLDELSLDGLERLVLRSTLMQTFVLRCHERAFRRLLEKLPSPRSVTIVGGGLFPRTALVLRRIIPEATLQIIDTCEDHLQRAKPLLDPSVALTCRFFLPTFGATQKPDTDLIVIPLAFVGDRSAIYRLPPSRHMLVHDWIWRKRGESVVISVWLLKRLNLVRA